MGCRYVFKCERWFSKHHDDRQIERDLLPTEDTVQQIQVCTVDGKQ